MSKKITQKGIIGAFFKRLSQNNGLGWVNAISFDSTSDSESEEYGWLGQVPVLREWIGSRQAKGLNDYSFVIRNKKYEATIEILKSWIRRDKTSQILSRVGELADRANTHWAQLISKLIEEGASTTCYDGQYFFDTDHEEGKSGVQSNKISVDISALPAETHGTVTAPSVEEFQQAVLKAISKIMSFKDDQGEPMNESVSSFVVMVPTDLYFIAMNAASVLRGTNINEQLPTGLSVEIVTNPRLTWTDRFAVFVSGSSAGAFIKQEETAIDLKVKGEGSEYEFDNDAHQYGVDTNRAAGYGLWQEACQVIMT